MTLRAPHSSLPASPRTEQNVGTQAGQVPCPRSHSLEVVEPRSNSRSDWFQKPSSHTECGWTQLFRRTVNLLSCQPGPPAHPSAGPPAHPSAGPPAHPSQGLLPTPAQALQGHVQILIDDVTICSLPSLLTGTSTPFSSGLDEWRPCLPIYGVVPNWLGLLVGPDLGHLKTSLLWLGAGTCAFRGQSPIVLCK